MDKSSSLSNFVTLFCVIVTTILVVISHDNNKLAECQTRSLLHWRRDLEYRLNSYTNQRDQLNEILASSITQQQFRNERKSINATVQLRSRGSIRFTDLIIPSGRLILESAFARPMVRIMQNKSDSFVNSKMSELLQVQQQLDTIKIQLNDSRQQYIRKGLPMMGANQTVSLPGTWVFKQASFGHVLEANRVMLKQVNFSSVDKVLNETYMENHNLSLKDAQARLFFEGKKTFWKTVFEGRLKSGCCDRLRPLHTNRMMTRFGNQEVLSPVMFMNSASRTGYGGQQSQVDLIIGRLTSDVLFNRRDDFILQGNINSVPENMIQLNNLISIRDINQPKIFKTLVLTNFVNIHEANLAYSINSNRLIIGFANNPSLVFDLSHDQYLLRYSSRANSTPPMQHVAGPIIINSESHFINSLDGETVNLVRNFPSFVQNNLVQVNRRAIIRGPVQFDVLPMLQWQIQQQQQQGNRQGNQLNYLNNHVPIMHVSHKGLQVNLLNGMRIPLDLIVTPLLKPHQTIVIRGSRTFSNHLRVFDFLTVNNLVNGLRMPQDVIPLHLHDSFGPSLGYTNLAFTDGIVAHHLTIQGGILDELNLRDASGAGLDAQSLIMKSVFTPQSDGSQLIRAPLRILNLRVYGTNGQTGLINGFRPEQLFEFKSALLNQEQHTYGKKTFMNHVEVNDCVFQDINMLANWTNHLIRIDRPETVQTIHKKLAFVNLPTQIPSSVNIDRLSINFPSSNNYNNYADNMNFAPELYVLHQALLKATANNTDGRFRVDQVNLLNGGRINGIDLADIITLDHPFRFEGKFTMVGKVSIKSSLMANRVMSNYPIDVMDLVQFDRFRIPISAIKPIRLNNLVLASNNNASFVQVPAINGVPFTAFAQSIMSLTRPQTIDESMIFDGPINFEGFVRTSSSLNNLKSFRQFANNLKNSKYSFEKGIQCNAVLIN